MHASAALVNMDALMGVLRTEINALSLSLYFVSSPKALPISSNDLGTRSPLPNIQPQKDTLAKVSIFFRRNARGPFTVLNRLTNPAPISRSVPPNPFMRSTNAVTSNDASSFLNSSPDGMSTPSPERNPLSVLEAICVSPIHARNARVSSVTPPTAPFDSSLIWSKISSLTPSTADCNPLNTFSKVPSCSVTAFCVLPHFWRLRSFSSSEPEYFARFRAALAARSPNTLEASASVSPLACSSTKISFRGRIVPSSSLVLTPRMDEDAAILESVIDSPVPIISPLRPALARTSMAATASSSFIPAADAAGPTYFNPSDSFNMFRAD